MGIRASRLLRFLARAGDSQENINASNNLSFRRARGEVENTLRDFGSYLPLYKAAVRGEWREARCYFDEDPEALTASITIASETALHIAVGTGNAIDFVKKLVEEMTTENMALTDLHGDTALSVAAAVGNIEAAKILVNKNPDLPNISGKSGFPIHKAAQFGREKMVKYLREVTRSNIEPNPFVGESGGRLLIDVITADFYDIGLDLVKLYPEMATVEINGLDSPLSVLATKSTAFFSGRESPFTFRRYFSPVAFRRDVKKRDKAEADALELVKKLCKEILELNDDKVFHLLRRALHNAAKLGIPEIIEEIVEAFPPAIWFTDEDNYNVFQLAVLNRRENVFNLIYQMTDYKYLVARYIDPQDNNILHLVGRLPPSDRLHPILGPAFQVQRELQWFQEVSKFVQQSQKEAKNKQGRTPKMEFKEAHEELMKTGAKWLKHTASSSTVVATLVATVSFAGAMHLSRDDKNKNAISLFSINLDPVTVFAITDAISLLLSIAAILVFLSIITSQFTEASFLHALPLLLFTGLTLLLLSIITMASAFSINLYLLFGPTEASNLILLFVYVFLLLVFLAFMPLLLRVLFSINGWKMFGRKRLRTLH